jgi:hypothetical protein
VLSLLSVLLIAELLLASPVSDGNDGIDFSINFLPPFRFGEMLRAWCGGETRFPLGEVVLTQLIGESASLSTCGISSLQPLPETLEILPDLTVPVALEVDDREFELRALEGLGGFALEKFGGLSSRELEKDYSVIQVVTQRYRVRIQGEKYVISEPGKIKWRCNRDKLKEGVIFALYIRLLLVIFLFPTTFRCFTSLFHFFSEFNVSWGSDSAKTLVLRDDLITGCLPHIKLKNNPLHLLTQ